MLSRGRFGPKAADDDLRRLAERPASTLGRTVAPYLAVTSSWARVNAAFAESMVGFFSIALLIRPFRASE